MEKRIGKQNTRTNRMSEETFISFIFPSRSRPEKFYAAIDNITELCASKSFEIIAVLDFDDIMYQHDNLIKIQSLPENVHCYFGNSTGKIHSCNREVDKISDEAQIIVLWSDDTKATKHGFDNEIRKEYSEGFIGLLHYPDGFQNRNIVTLPIMHRKYLQLHKYIYHPDYESLYADDEMTAVARLRGLYRFVDKTLIKHEHYRAGYGQPDELMLRNDNSEMYIRDKAVFDCRKAINFDIV